MKELDKLIEERGFKDGEVVKIGYNEIVKFTNQRVIEELTELIRDVDGYVNIVPRHLIKTRIKELKQ